MATKMSANSAKRLRETSDESDESVEDSSEELEDDSTTTESELSDSESCCSLSSARKGRRDAIKDRYLKGTSHKPYVVKKVISKSLEDEHLDTAAKVCKSCSPVLQKYSDTFMSLKQQGNELKKRRKINPHTQEARQAAVSGSRETERVVM